MKKSLVLLLILTGCAGLNTAEQRMVSGAAMGGTVGGPFGAGAGALVGYIVYSVNDKNE